MITLKPETFTESFKGISRRKYWRGDYSPGNKTRNFN